MVENIENPLHFDSGFSLGVTPRHISKCWVELNSSRNITFDSELGFRKKLIFMFPRLEILKIHFIFNRAFLERVTPRHISKLVELNSAEDINFDSELGFRKTFHFHVPPGWKSLKIHFILDLGFPEQFSQGISKMIGWKSLKIHFILGSELCLRRWKTLKIHFIFRFELFLRTDPKAYLKMWKIIANPLHFNPSFPVELAQAYLKTWNAIQAENITFDSELGFRQEAYFHVPQAENITFEAEFDLKNTSFSYSPWWKPLKIHIIFDSGFSLRSYPKAYLKMLGRTQFSQKGPGFLSSSPKAYLKMIGWKMFKIHIIFDSGFSLRSYPKAYLKILGWKTLKIHFIFRFELFLRTYPKAYLKMVGWKLLQIYFILIRAFRVELAQGISQNLGLIPRHISKWWVELNSGRKYNFEAELGFEKHFIFIFSMVENIKNPIIFDSRVEKLENPLHFRVRAFPEQFSQGISKNDSSDFKKNSFSCYPEWKMLQIHIIFNSGFSLRKAYLKILGRTLFSQNTYLLTQSSDFEKYFIFMFPRSSDFDKKLIFMFPRLEIIAHLLHFNPSFPCGVSTGHISKLGSDFEKHFIFMFPRVENFENPLYFRISALPEKLTQGISENLEWKRLKIHFILGSGPSLSSSPKAYLKMIGWKSLSIPFMLGSELCVRSYCRAYLKILGRTRFNQKS
ncbi:hypothetical protein E2320_000113 [Naja naja]|nr:hypothetical protein E2320_000113 [Naja naja]